MPPQAYCAVVGRMQSPLPAMGAAGRSKMWRFQLPPLAALALGVLLGSSLTWHSPGRSLAVWQSPQPAPRPQEACPPVTLTPSGAGAAFQSFIYPTWPVSHQKPADKPPKAPKKPTSDAPVNEDALWGYVPALDPRGMQRGLLHLGDPARLRRALYKLLTGEKTVVAAVGGSISVGRGSATQGSDIDTKWPSYLDQYAAWLQTAFPQAAPQLVNKAQSGSTSNIFDACAEAMVPKDADIVIAEFAMNDGTQAACKGDGSGSVPARASFERLIRKLQALPNRPAVIVMDAYSFVRGAVGSYLKNAENDMSIIAAYYGLPVLSVRAATFHQMLRNQHGYKVDRVRQETLDSSAPDELFLWDISHPYGPTGHRYMAELLIGLTQMTAGSLQARPLDEQEHFMSAEPLPPPVIPGNYDKAAASCVMNRAFEGVVVEKKGFQWVNERPDAKSENDEKWGWIGEKPGDYVVLGLDSRSSGDASGSGRGIEDALLPVLNKRAHLLLDSYNKLRAVVATPLNVSAVVEGHPDPEAGGKQEAPPAEEAVQSQVLIGHLASYKGMGRASVECVSGCACEPTVLDGWWERHASLQVMHTIRVSEHPGCRIKLTVLNESTGKGKEAGHKVKLMAALVLAGTSTEGLSKPGKLAAITRTAFVGATSGGDHGEVLTCNTVKCKEGHICKIKHGHPKCIHACAVHRCKRGHYCTLKDGQPECVSKCARKKCAEGKTCKLKRGKPRCVRQKPEDTVNPCAFTLCAIGNQCVVENGKAECISVCASVRCKDGLECQPDEKGNPQCVAAGAPNPCAFTTCLVGNFCQVEDGKALCVTNCATVKCAAGTRCETDPQNGNPVCVPDN